MKSNINSRTLVNDPTFTGKLSMIDKLEMRTREEIKVGFLGEQYPGFQISRIADSYYRICFTVKKENEVLITLKTKPVWPNNFISKITLNPSKWTSSHEMTRFLSKVCSIEKLEITRIDHALDLPMPIEQIFSAMRLKHKKDHSHCNENTSYKGLVLTGCYFGQKPELICIYDKGYEMPNKKPKRNNLYERGVTTRIELRQFGVKIAFKEFLNLRSYIENPPFEGIELYKIDDSVMHEPKAKELLKLMNASGLQRARAILNSNNNFDRDYRKYLEPTNFNVHLNQKYQEELRQFFEVQRDNAYIEVNKIFESWGN